MPATNYTKIGATGTPATPGASPAPNVTLGGSPTFAYNSDGNLEITESYTPPGTLGTFAGIHWYAEMPDQQSASPLVADGATAWDGTLEAVGNNQQNIVDIGKRDYDPNNLTQVFDLPPVTQDMTIRLVARSYSNQVENPYSTAPSVTIAVTPDTGATKVLAADAYTPMATWGGSPASVGATYNLNGKLDQDITFSGIVVPALTIPKKFSGWEIWSSGWPNQPVDVPYNQETGTLDGTSTVVTVAAPTAPLPITFWLVSVAGVGTRVKRNPIVPGITPSVVVTIGTTGGTLDLGAVIAASIDSTTLAILNGKLAITAVDLKLALGGSYNTTDLHINPTTHLLEIAGIDLGKAISATVGAALAVTGGVMDVTNLAATKITAGTLASSVILASSIAATQILAGTLAVGVVYAGTINASQITAGTIAAVTITAVTINGGTINGTTLNLVSGGVTTIIDNGSRLGTLAGLTVYTTSGSDSPVIITPGGIRIWETLSSNTKFFLNGSNGSDTQMSLYKTGAVEYLRVTSSGILIDTTGAGIFGGASLQGSALFLGGSQVLGTPRTGWHSWTGTATRTSFATSSATLQNVAEALKALIDDLTSHGMIGL